MELKMIDDLFERSIWTQTLVVYSSGRLLPTEVVEMVAFSGFFEPVAFLHDFLDNLFIIPFSEEILQTLCKIRNITLKY
jgi:hypothetical protein